MLPVIRKVDQLRQHRKTPDGKLPHDPVVCMLIRAGKGVFARHDRIHKVKPRFAHGFAEDLLHIGGADLGLENIAALAYGPIRRFWGRRFLPRGSGRIRGFRFFRDNGLGAACILRDQGFSEGPANEGVALKHRKNNEHGNQFGPVFFHDCIHSSINSDLSIRFSENP